MKDSLYSDLPEGCYPPLPPAKGGIFLREGNKEAVPLVSWNHVFEATHQLPSKAIPNERAFIALAHVVYVWKDRMWHEDKEAKQHIDRCVLAGNFNVLDINYIDVPDPSEEAGITYSSKDRREWTIGNWIAHLGGRINNAGYLEFGSIYAFNMMITQMRRADYKGSEEKMRITIDGGDNNMKVALASMLLGSMVGADCNCNTGSNLNELVDQVNVRSTDADALDRLASSIKDTEVIVDVLPLLRR